MHGAWRRQNASGDAEMRRGDASRSGRVVSARLPALPPEAWARPWLPLPAPLMLDRPRNARPLCSRPPPPAAAGRLGHRFPRSHGPPGRKVKTQWLTLRCPAKPSPSSAAWIGSGPRAASQVEMPNKPERRRNRRETAGHARRAARGRTDAGPSCEPGSDADRSAEGTRAPRECWRMRGCRGGNEAGATKGRSAPIVQSAPIALPIEPCLVDLWHGGGAPTPCTGSARGVGDRNEPRDPEPVSQRDPAPLLF